LKSTGILIVNPDEVAKGLSPDSPEALAYEAARVADTWRPRSGCPRYLVLHGDGVF
jgi:predicted ABC-type ATPase